MRRAAVVAPLVTLAIAWSSVVLAQSPCGDDDGDGYVAGDGCATQADCNNRDPAIHPGAPEVCNGRDDDCDGEIDEGCDRICPDFGIVTKVILHENNAASPAITVTPGGFGVEHEVEFYGFPLVAYRINDLGEHLSPERVYAEDVPRGRQITWTGTELEVSWATDGTVGDVPGLFASNVGRWGRRRNPVLVLREGKNLVVDDTPWTGYESGVFSYETGALSDPHRLERTTAKPTLLSVDTLATGPYSGDFVWNGHGYGWIYDRYDSHTGHYEVFFQALDAHGALVGPELRVTDHLGSSARFGVIFAIRLLHLGPGRGYATVWVDDETGYEEFWFARLDEDGNLVDPPGTRQITFRNRRNSAREGDLAWTGEEFMFVTVDPSALEYIGQIQAIRLSLDGDVLGTLNLTDGFAEGDPRIAWNGHVFGIVYEANTRDYPAGTPDVEYVALGCRCSTDGDGDGVLPCGGGDCDDTDPEVGAGIREVCTDGKDNDCDGLVDCNDPDCGQGGNPPGEIAGLVWSGGKETLSWQSDSKASSYDVARGGLLDLAGMESFRWTACAANRVGGTEWVDAEIPPLGDGFYYVVRGRAKTCLVGTWGTAERDGSLHGCP